MGIISSSSPEKQIPEEKSKETEKPPPLKEPQDNIKKLKSNKKPKNSKKKPKTNSKKELTKKIFTNKAIKTNNTSNYTIKTLPDKRHQSKENPNKEIKKIIFQNTKRTVSNNDKKINKIKKSKFNTQLEQRKLSINYNNFSKGIDEDEFDIIYNEDDSDESLEIIRPTNNNKNTNKTLKEKINSTKKKIINLRKKLNTEINNSSKEMNVKNKIQNNFTISNNNNIKPNKISNTIFINNSNITISNTARNYIKPRLMKKKNNNSVLTDYNIKNNYNNYTNNTYIHPNLDSIEIDDLISNVFPQKEIDGNNYNKRINKNKTDRRFYYTESDLNFMPIKTNTENTSNNNKNSLSQYQKYINKKKENVIINKMAELKEKIKNTPSTTRRTYQLYTHKTTKNQKNQKKSETLDNKHIKKNIPSYRRSYSRSNNVNVGAFNAIIENIDKKEKINEKKNDKTYAKSLLNSNNKKKSIKNNYNFSFKRREKNTLKNNRLSQDNGINNTIKYKSIQLNLNNSNNNININNNSNSLKNLISFDQAINEQKKIKNKYLYNTILQNIISIDNNNNENNDNKDINSIDQILILKYRDAIDLDISGINIKESLIDKKLIESNINNKIIINFSKLDNISTNQILFDGIIYKVVDNCSNNNNKNKNFKIMERYFQLKKNCFRYFNNVQLARYNTDKPLVQFDIRHIKDLKIIDKKIFEEYDLNNKKIEFCFSVFLNQNSDFFVFILDNENFGNSLFSFMNLLKHYYEDKNKNNI